MRFATFFALFDCTINYTTTTLFPILKFTLLNLSNKFLLMRTKFFKCSAYLYGDICTHNQRFDSVLQVRLKKNAISMYVITDVIQSLMRIKFIKNLAVLTNALVCNRSRVN